MTRRWLLSIISSAYDPLGLAAPFLLQGRLLNQELCKPTTFGTLMEYSLHRFGDTCKHGYGQVSYLHLGNNNGRIHCSLMIGKVCVTSLKVMTIPRMGLAAATLSAKLSILLKKELEILVNKDKSWTDSEVVQATLEMNQRGSIYLWQTEVNSSKIIQMNPSGITLVLNKT